MRNAATFALASTYLLHLLTTSCSPPQAHSTALKSRKAVDSIDDISCDVSCSYMRSRRRKEEISATFSDLLISRPFGYYFVGLPYCAPGNGPDNQFVQIRVVGRGSAGNKAGSPFIPILVQAKNFFVAASTILF